MTCAQGLLRLLWGGRSWSATGLLVPTKKSCRLVEKIFFVVKVEGQ